MSHSVRKENPELPMKKINIIVSKKWKILSEEDKNVYYLMAEEDKKRYIDEINSRNKISPRPKRTNAYIVYRQLQVEKLKFPDKSAKEIKKIISINWKHIKNNKEEFKIYQAIADKINKKDEEDEKVEKVEDKTEDIKPITKPKSTKLKSAKPSTNVINSDEDYDLLI
jgi:hypothetical protein